MLVMSCLKSFMLGFRIVQTRNFQMSKLGLKKKKKKEREREREDQEIKLPMFSGSLIKQGNSIKSIYLCFFNYAKAFDYVDHNKLWRDLRQMGIPDTLTSLLRNL